MLNICSWILKVGFFHAIWSLKSQNLDFVFVFHPFETEICQHTLYDLLPSLSSQPQTLHHSMCFVREDRRTNADVPEKKNTS